MKAYTYILQLLRAVLQFDKVIMYKVMKVQFVTQ